MCATPEKKESRGATHMAGSMWIEQRKCFFPLFANTYENLGWEKEEIMFLKFWTGLVFYKIFRDPRSLTCSSHSFHSLASWSAVETLSVRVTEWVSDVCRHWGTSHLPIEERERSQQRKNIYKASSQRGKLSIRLSTFYGFLPDLPLLILHFLLKFFSALRAFYSPSKTILPAEKGWGLPFIRSAYSSLFSPFLPVKKGEKVIG